MLGWRNIFGRLIEWTNNTTNRIDYVGAYFVAVFRKQQSEIMLPGRLREVIFIDLKL